MSLWLSIAAGVAFGIGVWVRPTNILIALPLALIVHLRWKPLLGMAAGALPFGVALMVWSAKLYGSPFRTGYGDISMTWEGVLNAAPQHAQWLLIMLSALVFPLGLLVVFDRMVDGWTRVMLAVWFVSFFVFYSFYGFFDGWLCIRFLLPAIPALIFGTLLLLRDFFVLVSRYNRAVAAAIVAGAMLFMCKAPVQSGFDLSLFPILGTTEISYPHYISWVERRLPKRAVVVTGVLSGGFLYYANRSIVRYDQLNDERFQILRAYAGMQNLPWYAVVSDEEIDFEALRQRFRGDWKFVAHLNDVTIYRLDS